MTRIIVVIENLLSTFKRKEGLAPLLIRITNSSCLFLGLKHLVTFSNPDLLLSIFINIESLASVLCISMCYVLMLHYYDYKLSLQLSVLLTLLCPGIRWTVASLLQPQTLQKQRLPARRVISSSERLRRNYG